MIENLRKIFGRNLHILDEDSNSVQDFVADINCFSDAVLKLLKKSHIELHIGDRFFTQLYSGYNWRNATPRGWPDGSSYDQIEGAYAGNKVILAGRGEKNSVSAAAHEIAHALHDHRRIPKFIIKRLHQVWLKHFNALSIYYQQLDVSKGSRDPAGFEEFIAESMAYMVAKKRGVIILSSFLGGSLSDIEKAYEGWMFLREESDGK